MYQCFYDLQHKILYKFLDLHLNIKVLGFPGSSAGKESICNAGDPIQFLGWEDPLEKG